MYLPASTIQPFSLRYSTVAHILYFILLPPSRLKKTSQKHYLKYTICKVWYDDNCK